MLYDVLFYWKHLQERDLSNAAVVVADVLRATTVMTVALSNGAKEILPQANDDRARALYAELKAQGEPALLCGEKEGFKREGYDLGNSPLEFTQQVVQGKTIVHLTTNGTRALKAAESARHVYLVSFSNMTAVMEHLWELKGIEALYFVVSGREGHYCMEDTVCLGGVLTGLLTPPGNSVNLTDAGRTAVDLFQIYRGDLLGMVKQCFHGRHLEEIGLGGDLPECVKVDTVEIVPEMVNGKVRSV